MSSWGDALHPPKPAPFSTMGLPCRVMSLPWTSRKASGEADFDDLSEEEKAVPIVFKLSVAEKVCERNLESESDSTLTRRIRGRPITGLIKPGVEVEVDCVSMAIVPPLYSSISLFQLIHLTIQRYGEELSSIICRGLPSLRERNTSRPLLFPQPTSDLR